MVTKFWGVRGLQVALVLLASMALLVSGVLADPIVSVHKDRRLHELINRAESYEDWQSISTSNLGMENGKAKMVNTVVLEKWHELEDARDVWNQAAVEAARIGSEKSIIDHLKSRAKNCNVGHYKENNYQHAIDQLLGSDPKASLEKLDTRLKPKGPSLALALVYASQAELTSSTASNALSKEWEQMEKPVTEYSLSDVGLSSALAISRNDYAKALDTLEAVGSEPYYQLAVLTRLLELQSQIPNHFPLGFGAKRQAFVEQVRNSMQAGKTDEAFALARKSYGSSQDSSLHDPDLGSICIEAMKGKSLREKLSIGGFLIRRMASETLEEANDIATSGQAGCLTALCEDGTASCFSYSPNTFADKARDKILSDLTKTPDQDLMQSVSESINEEDFDAASMACGIVTNKHEHDKQKPVDESAQAAYCLLARAKEREENGFAGSSYGLSLDTINRPGAIPLLEKAIAPCAKLYGSKSSQYRFCLILLADALCSAGKTDRAKGMYEQAAAIPCRPDGNTNKEFILVRLAALALRSGKISEAEILYRQANPKGMKYIGFSATDYYAYSHQLRELGKTNEANAVVAEFAKTLKQNCDRRSDGSDFFLMDYNPFKIRPRFDLALVINSPIKAQNISSLNRQH